MADETLPIRIVETDKATNRAGHAVSVLPARYVDADTDEDETGSAIETVPFEVVEGLVTLNSAGHAVPVIPVRIVEGRTALNEVGALVPVIALRGTGGTPTPTPAPSWSVDPSISGTPTVGETLTGSDGTISNGTVSARAWLRGASAISGATGATYLLVEADEGEDISFRVTATGAGGSAQATSDPVGPIAPAPDVTAPIITSDDPSGSYVEGEAIGGTLTANEPVTWAVTGTDASAVTLDPDTGVWSLEETDYATKSSYSFSFVATDLAENESDPQVVAITITEEPALPGDISDLSAVATGNDVLLSWTPATDATSHEYRIDGGSWNATDENDEHLIEGLLYDTEYDFEVRGVNVVGNGNASNVATETTDAAPGLSAPDVTVTSDPGDPPEVTIGLKSDHFAGYFLRIQRNADGATDGNGDYTDQTLEASSNGVLYFISAEDLADGITNLELAAVGYIDPTGVYFQQYRIENEIGQVSPWVEIDGNVVVATTVFHTSNGTNKNQFVTVDDRRVYLTDNGIGANCAARATQQPTSDLTQFEVTLTDLSTDGFTVISVDDGSVVYGPSAFPTPGLSSAAGVSLRVRAGSGCEIVVGGAGTSVSAGEDGDVISVTINKTNGEIKFYRTRGGTTTQLGGTFTPSLTSWYAAVGHSRIADATANFGQEPFVRALDTGFAIHG